eukprot:7352-Eustigmatos_ZCMA.PRE.1
MSPRRSSALNSKVRVEVRQPGCLRARALCVECLIEHEQRRRVGPCVLSPSVVEAHDDAALSGHDSD